MNRRPAPIREFHEPGRPFRKSLQRLPQPMKRELAAVIDELLAGELSAGRRYEKLETGDDPYSLRLSRGYRFVFRLDPEGGGAWPIAVGPHDETYRQAFRSIRRR